MKYLLVLAVVLIAFWFWREARRTALRSRPRPAPPTSTSPGVAPQAILECAQCGLHLPASEAVTGQRGSYCSAAHRQAAEAA